MGNIPCNNFSICSNEKMAKSIDKVARDITGKQVMTDDDLIVAKGQQKTGHKVTPADHNSHRVNVHAFAVHEARPTKLVSTSELGVEERLLQDFAMGKSGPHSLHSSKDFHRVDCQSPEAEIDNDITPRNDVDFSTLTNSGGMRQR